MNVLDENIIESQVQLLHSWHIKFRQIGVDVGRKGMQDDEIIPLLHNLRRPTLFTRDQRFYTRDTPHHNYCIVVLGVKQNEVATFVRRFLKHPQFNTEIKRLGLIVAITHEGIRMRQLKVIKEKQVLWH